MIPWILLPVLLLMPQLSSSLEQSIVAAVDAHNADGLALLEKVVNINSGTRNFAGVRKVGDVFRAELDALGFRTRWIDGGPFQRAGHLVADHPGTGPRFLLIGHLDTVFEADSPFQTFQRIDERTAKGPGVIDMKGGDVIIVQALKALEAAGVLKTLNVIVVMTGDEEDSGEPQSLARAALVEAAKGADYALGFEDGPGDPRYAVTARRGTSSWTLESRVLPAHSSQIFRADVGYGAIYEAGQDSRRLPPEARGPGASDLQPGVMLGGTSIDFDAGQSRGTAFGKENVVAERALVAGDLRTLSKEQLAEARQAMQAVVAEALPRTPRRR